MKGDEGITRGENSTSSDSIDKTKGSLAEEY